MDDSFIAVKKEGLIWPTSRVLLGVPSVIFLERCIFRSLLDSPIKPVILISLENPFYLITSAKFKAEQILFWSEDYTNNSALYLSMGKGLCDLDPLEFELLLQYKSNLAIRLF